ncbi:MAG TPA: cytochrome c3 family protein [Pirellulales bacterium]
MPQVFPRSANAISRAILLASFLATPMLMWFCLTFTRSSYGTDAGIMRDQAIPFSHEHHVGVLGIDCRYCHTSVEESSFAGLPDTKTCMNCHSQIWVGSNMLRPVRESYQANTPLHWRRVHNLPNFVYFDHSIHVQKGIGCSSCHGRIDEMPFTFQSASLLMEWCLDCHRHPERQIRPREQIFDILYRRPADQSTLGPELVERYDVDDAVTLTSCSVCHR